jgi:polyketide synthase PksN
MSGGLSDIGSPAGPAAGHLDWLHKPLIDTLAESLYLEPANIHIDKPFLELGLDSIVGVEWIRALNKRFNTRIGVNAVYAYPSIRAFADYLHHELGADAPAAVPAATATSREPADSEIVQQAAIESGSRAASLDDLLRQVQQGTIDIDSAEKVLHDFAG